MNTDENNDVEKYYNQALQFTKSHYENFPVVSSFIKKDLRKHVATIYQFARQADDLADEGNISEDERFRALTKYELELRDSLSLKSENGFWKILKLTIDKKKLDSISFQNLINAFKQDLVKKRYKNYDELLCYCKSSANPVGRLILELHDIRDEIPISLSDKICTALQLTNFYQDVSVDILKDRVYLPESELSIFNVNEKDIKNKKYSEQFVQLMKFQIERTKKLFYEGRELLNYLPYRLRIQILVTIKGGEAILTKIEEIDYNVLEIRPTLNKIDVFKLFTRALILRR